MRLSAKSPIVIRGEEITHLDADGYKHLPRATSLPDGKVLATSGGKWGASDLSGVSVASVFGRTGAVTAQTGDYTAAQVGALAASLKGTANGVAELGADGRVPTTQLPSYVDDVLECANFAALPATGETGKIYITQNDNKTWRWSGTAYAEISASLALGETSSTAHRGDHGAIAYSHSQAAGNPHGATAAQVGAAEADHEHSTDDVTSGILPTSRGGTGNNDIPSGFLISTNQYVQSMGLTDNTVPFYGGAAQGFWNLQFSPEFSVSSGSDPVLSFAGIAWSKVSKTGAVAADVGAAPLAGAELLIHSDFGRVISTTGWQSTFTSNAASGLKLAANTVTNGTQIRFEQLFQGAGSVSGAWQLVLGPLLPAGTGPTYPAYLDVIQTDVVYSHLGRLIIEIEFLGSGSSMIAHVTSRVDCDAFGGNRDQVSNGTIPFDATVDRYLDIQVQPAGMTGPVIRRNRVFRRNP